MKASGAGLLPVLWHVNTHDRMILASRWDFVVLREAVPDMGSETHKVSANGQGSHGLFSNWNVVDDVGNCHWQFCDLSSPGFWWFHLDTCVWVSSSHCSSICLWRLRAFHHNSIGLDRCVERRGNARTQQSVCINAETNCIPQGSLETTDTVVPRRLELPLIATFSRCWEWVILWEWSHGVWLWVPDVLHLVHST